MKKNILIMLAMLLAIIGSAFADAHGDGPEIAWSFSPEVSTTAGFNLDSAAFGLEGVAKIDIEGVIRAEADEEFRGEGTNYGYIKVEDLKIRVNADDAVKNTYDNSENAASMDMLQLSVGTISGTVYMGPVFIELHNYDVDGVSYVNKGLDDADLYFSNISYSVIPAYWTGRYSGQKIDDTSLTTDGTINASPTEEGVASTQILNGTAGLSLGLALPDLLEVSLTYETLYGYKAHQPTNYNPLSLTLFFALDAIENLVLNVEVATSAGNEVQLTGEGEEAAQSGIMDENNPLRAGLLVGYGLAMGDKTLTPKLGFEIAIENQHRMNGSILKLAKDHSGFAQASDTARKGGVDNGKIQTISYEAALGVTYDWKSLGNDEDESDHLSMAANDVKVTDGVSFSTVYGVVPYTEIRSLMAPYLGVKIALWESEDDDKPGLIPNLKAGLVTNLNYTLGGTLDAKDQFNDAGGKAIYKKYEFEYASRMDFGLGLETSYQMGSIKPYLGGILKLYDLTDATMKTTQQIDATGKPGEEVITPISDGTSMIQKGDARLKIGFEVTKIISNTTFTVEYQSGNLLRDALTEVDKENLTNTGYEFFKNNPSKGSIDPMNNTSPARLGFVSAGIKVSF